MNLIHKLYNLVQITLLTSHFTNLYTCTIQCDRTVALNAFFDQIISDPVKIGVIGSGCSVATEPTAEISHYYNITHVRTLSDV